MNLDHKAVRTVRRALAWWIEGLWLGLPPAWRQNWFPARQRVALELTSDLSRGEYRAMGDTEGVRIPVALGEISDADALRGDAIGLTVVIDRSEGLTKTFSLPTEAESELRSLLRLELDRTTPFDSDDIHFDYEVTGRNPEAGILRVNVGIVRRSYLAEVEKQLEAARLQPQRITTSNADGLLLGINWIRDTAPFQLPFARSPLQPAVVAALLVSLAIVLYAGAARLERLDERYGDMADAVRGQAVDRQTATNSMATAVERAAFYRAIEHDYIPPVEVLADLSAALPDSAWVSRFGMSSDSVQLQGEATGASGLLEIVASLPALDLAEFQSPVTLNEGTRKESFAIVAALATQEPPR